MNFYAVRKGKKPGIYMTWSECKDQVHGHKGAEFKKFTNKDDALAYIKADNGMDPGDDALTKPQKGRLTAYVDGSYNQKTSVYGYGLVLFSYEGKKTFSGSFEGEDSASRNVAGEIMAARKAMSLALEEKAQEINIVYDYAGIRHWALGEWKTNLDLTKNYKAFAQEALKKIKINFVKVKSHTGDKYNDEADLLAKKACGIKT